MATAFAFFAAVTIAGTARAQGRLPLACELTPAQEVPPTTSPAFGTGSFTLDPATGQMSVDIQFSGLVASETAAHIHFPAAPGVNGPVKFPLPLGSPISTSVTWAPGDIANVIAGLAYVNVHSSAFPGGEIRGQIRPGLYANGVRHEPCGNASLAVAPGGDLVVANIGSSGQDGVELVSGPAQGMCVALTTAACVSGTAMGEASVLAAGGSNALGTWSSLLTLTNVGTHVDVEGTFPATGPGGITDTLGFIDAYIEDDGDVIASGFYTAGQVVAEIPLDACIIEVDWVVWDVTKDGFSLLFDQPILINLPGFGSYTGDRLRIDPEYAISGLVAQPLGQIERFGIKLAGASTFSLDMEVIQQFGNLHSALGDGAIHTADGLLGISNIGSSGNDGVSVHLGKAESASVTFDELDPSGTAPLGARLKLSAAGSLNGVPGQSLGSATFTKNAGGTYSILADFSNIAAPTVRVQVFDAGNLVADLPGQTASVGTVTDLPTKGGKLGGQLECFVACWPTTVTVDIGGTLYPGDELRVLAEGSPSTIEYKSELDLSTNVGPLRIRGETVVPAATPPMVSFCSPGIAGVIACPCGNPPAGPNQGCENSSGTGGAQLSASGAAQLSADTLVFVATGEKPTATSVVLQGNLEVASGLAFGQGVRCVGGSLKRLYVKNAVAGTITAPSVGDPAVSARSAALGDPISPGEQRWYMVYYRDPIVLGGCPPSSTFNATQGGRVSWLP